MRSKICFMYTGQGSQYYEMAKALYENNIQFRRCMNELDEVAVMAGGSSVVQELYYNKKAGNVDFTELIFTHPAIFMVEYALTNAMKSMGIEPDILIGSSLGEITSFAAAGCESVEKLLEFVVKQAFLFKECCECGGMLTVLDNFEAYTGHDILGNDTEIISINYSNHFVISGEKTGIDRIESILKRKGITYFRLPVNFGFHFRQLDAAYEDFISLTENLKCVKSDIPIYSSSAGCEITGFTSQTLWNIVRNKINFNQTLLNIKNLNQTVLIDVGPSGTLASFSKIILNRKDDIASIITPFHTEERNLMNIKAMLDKKQIV